MNYQSLKHDIEASDIDELALFLSPKNILMHWLLNTAIRRKHSVQQMCHELGVSFTYLLELSSEKKRTKDITNEFAIRCAEYIGVVDIPIICIKIAAGQISLRDFEPACVNEERHYEDVLNTMREDHLVAGLVPAALFDNDTPFEIRRFVAFLWGELTGKDVLDTKWIPLILRNVREACEPTSNNTR
jgi:hypothetical protein